MTQFTNFVSSIKKNGVAKSSHFFCYIMPPANLTLGTANTAESIPFYIEGVSIPEIALATSTVKDAGLNREVVYDKMYGRVVMTMFSDQNMSIKKYFDNWITSAIIDKGGIFAYPDDYTADSMCIYNVDTAKMVTYVTVLNRVYPKIVDDVVLSNSNKNSLSFRVEFTYESWDSYQVDTTDPNAKFKKNTLDSLRSAMDLVNLIRGGGLSKKNLKSMLINVGVKKIANALGNVDGSIASKVDKIVGSTGIPSVINKLKGVIL